MTYADAICQALTDAMTEDDSIVVMGQAVDDVKPTYGTTTGLTGKFGRGRAFNTPLSEEGMTGVAIGMALAGLRPVLIHIRADFLLLSMNQLVNMAAKIRWMYGGRLKCPLVIRVVIGKSWGQGPQHSQGIYPMLMGVPGLRIVAPVFPGSAYLALRAALREDELTLFIEHRLLHDLEGDWGDHLPEPEMAPRSIKTDVTLFGVSYMAVECLRAASLLSDAGVTAEVVVPHDLAPLSLDVVEHSVRRTSRLVTVDCAWTMCGAGAEIVACLTERGILPAGQIRRLGFATTACPTSPALEQDYYPTARTIAKAAYALVTGNDKWEPAEAIKVDSFKGPF